MYVVDADRVFDLIFIVTFMLASVVSVLDLERQEKFFLVQGNHQIYV